MSQNTQGNAVAKISKVTKALLVFCVFASVGFSVAADASQKNKGRQPASVEDAQPEVAASEVSLDKNNVQIVIDNQGNLSSAYGKCQFDGDLAAIASSIELHIDRGEFKKLELSAFGGECKISLDQFRRDEENPNMVFKNDDGCTVVLNVVRRSTNAQGFRMLIPDGVTTETAILSAQTVPGTCNQFCPRLKAARKVWQIMMNPRTEKCE